MHRRSCALVALGIALAAPASADDAVADRWFRAGNDAMARNETAAAVAAYRAAWQHEPRAKIALNLGIALAEDHDISHAAEAFEVYLADPASDPAKRAIVDQHLGEWREGLGRIALRVLPSDAAITIDGMQPLHGGGDVNVPVVPGVHRIAIARAGYVAREVTVTVVARQTVESREQLEPVARPRSRAPWIAFGVAGAAALVGGYEGVVAMRRWNTVHDHCPDDICSSAADLALADRARSAGTVATVAFAAAGVALATGLVLHWRAGSHEQALTIAPTGSGGMVGWHVAY